MEKMQRRNAAVVDMLAVAVDDEERKKIERKRQISCLKLSRMSVWKTFICDP